MNALVIRFAEEQDAALILDFIKELAVYEGMANEVTATADDIRASLFERRQAEVIIGEINRKPAAFALFFHNYSTFLGGANLFLEDLFVKEQNRGNGVGRAMLRRLAQIAAERGCKRLDWLVLDDNAAGAEFYFKHGAKKLSDRRVFRLEKEALTAFAASR